MSRAKEVAMIVTISIMVLVWAASDTSAAPVDVQEACEDPPFEAGEMARFVARVGFIKVGESVSLLRRAPLPPAEPPLVGAATPGQETWHFRGRAISVPPISFFYKVNDTLESWARLGSFLPLR